MKELTERVGLLALAGAFVWLLRQYGGLPFEASVLIGSAFAAIAMWLYMLKKIAAFRPFRIIVGINYEAIRADLNLAASVDGPKFENFTFIAIGPSTYSRSDEALYSSTLTLSKPVPCGKPTWTAGLGENSDDPIIYFRPVRKGYEFGVHLQEAWWNAQSQQASEDLRGRKLTNHNDLVLGFLPSGYLLNHIRLWDEPVSLLYRFDAKQRYWKKRLQALGWTFDDDSPAHIFHRYLGISYSDI